MFGIFLDVTGRKQAEEANELMAGEMSHRVKNLPDHRFRLDRDHLPGGGTAAEMAKDLTHRLGAPGPRARSGAACSGRRRARRPSRRSVDHIAGRCMMRWARSAGVFAWRFQEWASAKRRRQPWPWFCTNLRPTRSSTEPFRPYRHARRVLFIAGRSRRSGGPNAADRPCRPQPTLAALAAAGHPQRIVSARRLNRLSVAPRGRDHHRPHEAGPAGEMSPGAGCASPHDGGMQVISRVVGVSSSPCTKGS